MTREEAIRAMQFYKEKLYNGIFNQYIDAFDMAISALRQQEHFREVTKKVEPLTLDELRKMDETVWVCYPQPTFGTNLLSEHMDCTRYKFSFADYGKTWLAYRQKQ